MNKHQNTRATSSQTVPNHYSHQCSIKITGIGISCVFSWLGNCVGNIKLTTANFRLKNDCVQLFAFGASAPLARLAHGGASRRWSPLGLRDTPRRVVRRHTHARTPSAFRSVTICATCRYFAKKEQTAPFSRHLVAASTTSLSCCCCCRPALAFGSRQRLCADAARQLDPPRRQLEFAGLTVDGAGGGATPPPFLALARSPVLRPFGSPRVQCARRAGRLLPHSSPRLPSGPSLLSRVRAAGARAQQPGSAYATAACSSHTPQVGLTATYCWGLILGSVCDESIQSLPRGTPLPIDATAGRRLLPGGASLPPGRGGQAPQPLVLLGLVGWM